MSLLRQAAAPASIAMHWLRRGLLRGLGARTLEMSVLSAVAAVGYEQIKRASLKTATQDAFSS